MVLETSSEEEEEANPDQWVKQDKIRKLATKMVQREQKWFKQKQGQTSKQAGPDKPSNRAKDAQ